MARNYTTHLGTSALRCRAKAERQCPLSLPLQERVFEMDVPPLGPSGILELALPRKFQPAL